MRDLRFLGIVLVISLLLSVLSISFLGAIAWIILIFFAAISVLTGRGVIYQRFVKARKQKSRLPSQTQ